MSPRRPGRAGLILAAFGLAVLLLVPCFTLPSPIVSAAPDPNLAEPVFVTRLYLDGERIVLPVPAVVADGHTLVPVRGVFEKLGATVDWDGTSRVTIKDPTHEIVLWVGSEIATVDDHLVPLEVPAALWQSRVMVPLRFVVENMGLELAWDNDRRAVLLASEPAPPVAAGEDDTGPGGSGGSPGSVPPDPEPPAPRDITLAFGGDTMLAMWIGDLIKANGADYPWGGVAPTLKAADLAMVNLECCASTRGTAFDKTWTFRADPASLDGLVWAGVDIVSLGNNHVGDYGPDAMLDTFAALDQRRIARVGAGANKDEAWKPAVLEAKGYKVGFLGATQFYPEVWVPTSTRPGICSARDVEALATAVKDLHGKVDIVVVNVHWGTEYDANPDAFERKCGRALVDAGADLVIGHHPHILQGIEVYKGVPIVYSLGNFIFTYKNREAQDSGMVVATFDEQGLAAVRFLPDFTDTGRTVLETGEDYDRIMANMTKLSAEWGTTFDPMGYVMMP